MKAMVDFAKALAKCIHCGKNRGYHQANTLNCPLGKPGRAGQTSYHPVNVFTPPEKKP